jgi:hypothetical protein
MNPIRAWNRFWFTPISARPLGLYRILFGLMVLAHLAFLTVDLDFWYTDAGLLQGDEARLVAGPLRLSPLQWIQDPVSVRVFFGALAVAAVAFTLGWHTRVMGVLVYLGLLSLHHRNISTNCGPDTLMMVTCFYLMLSPSGAALSLDARRLVRRRGTSADVLIIPWAQRLLQIQLCIIYFCTGQAKCAGSTWLGGTAVHFVLFNSEVRQFNLEWLAGYPLLINVMTHAALMSEFALAFLLWFRPTRRWVALLGVLLHAGIYPIVNVPLFGEQMVAMYILFLDADEFEALRSAFNWRIRFNTGSRASHLAGVRRAPPSGLKGWHQIELAFDAVEPAGRP